MENKTLFQKIGYYVVLPLAVLGLLVKGVMALLASGAKRDVKEAQEKDFTLSKEAVEANTKADVAKEQSNDIEKKIAGNQVDEDWNKK